MADTFELDPFSSVARIALLPYMPPGVKIGIVDNAIRFFHPTLCDTVRRTIASLLTAGCSKHALFNLEVPFRRAAAWYAEQAPDVLAMARDGLDVLSTNYVDGNVAATIRAVRRWLDDLDDGDDGDTDFAAKPAMRRLMEAWSPEELRMINGQAKLLRENPDREYLVKCIDDFIVGKEPEIGAILRESPVYD